jgi:hypothetical protein
MAVEVYPNAADRPQTYDKAQSTHVNETGHLMVTGASKAKVIAVYSPGNWHHAEEK